MIMSRCMASMGADVCVEQIEGQPAPLSASALWPVAKSKALDSAPCQEQRAALHYTLSDRQLSSVVGRAGAGRSNLLITVREAWEQQGFMVRRGALAGKAPGGLQSASGISSQTLSSLE